MTENNNIPKVIYIAGPITADPDYRKKFKAAEKRLRAKGFKTLNPAEGVDEGRTYRYYINRGLRQLMYADAIYMLKGWRISQGASLELFYAQTIGMDAIYEEKENEKK